MAVDNIARGMAAKSAAASAESVQGVIGDVNQLKEDLGNKLDNPATPGTAGQILGLGDDLMPKWIDKNWEKVMDYVTSDVEEASNLVYIEFPSNTYVKIFVIIDESEITGTKYSSVRFGIIGRNKNHSVFGLTNTGPAYLSSEKYKTFFAESLTKNLYRYDATSEVQLYGYIANKKSGQLFSDYIEIDFSSFSGIAWLGKIYANTKITVYGVRA